MYCDIVERAHYGMKKIEYHLPHYEIPQPFVHWTGCKRVLVLLNSALANTTGYDIILEMKAEISVKLRFGARCTLNFKFSQLSFRFDFPTLTYSPFTVLQVS